MALTVDDIINLRNGQPPENLQLVADMTIGTDLWIDKFLQYYLDVFIPEGGSKVKVLVGSEGSGKSHILKYLQYSAETKGYSTLFMSAKTAGQKMNDLPGLYRLISSNVDMEKVITGLCLKVSESLGYNRSIYDGRTKFLPYIIEEGYGAADAAREIRIATAKVLKDADFSPSLFTCTFTLIKDRLINDDDNASKTAIRWLRGEKLERFEKNASGLYETLQKATARKWLDSLLKLITFSGIKGFVVLVDDMDVMYERSADTGRFIYTPGNIKDTCELIRQIIDDAEMLKGLLFILAGRNNIIEDEKRGFKSYEALWMRLQTGLVPSGMFNSLCDIIDIDKHLESLGQDFPQKLSLHLSSIFSKYGLKRKYRESTPDFGQNKPLRAAVMENAFLCEDGEGV